MNWTAALFVALGYVLGSLSFATILVRFATGKDIRKEGSGNAGATNVLRSHGKGLGLAVAALDIGKGALAVWLVRLVTADSRYAAAAGVAAVLGHVFPVFYGFRGGKGVATAVGAFLVLAPGATLVCAVVFVLIVVATHYVSLGSVVSVALLPPLAGLLFDAREPVVVAGSAVAVLVTFKHIGNLKRLAAGTESRLGRRK
jgi:glycerol-3-phosphate acyltransferase PlsY